MSTSTQNSNSPEKPNETALILEHVELLLALYEEQGEKHSGNFDQLLDAKVTEIAAAVERQIEQRFETLENQIERISESITAQNTVLQSIGDSAGSSPESTAVHEEYQRELETRLESLVERFSEKTDTTAGLFKSQIEQMFEDFSLKVSKLTNGIGHGDTETDSTVFDPSSDDTASHWHKQKEAMLSKYGIDPDYRNCQRHSKTRLTRKKKLLPNQQLFRCPSPMPLQSRNSKNDSTQNYETRKSNFRSAARK